MSKIGDFYADLQKYADMEGFGEPADTAELQMERRCDALIRDLDELVAFTANAETVDLVERQSLAVGQMLTRIMLVASFLNARKPRLTVVSNNG